MKTLLTAFLIATVTTASAQSHLENDTLYTKSGFQVTEGQQLKIGTGSMPDGDFKYIRISSTSMFAHYSTAGYNGLANSANAFPRRNAGLQFKVVRIDKRGSKKNDYVYYPIINQAMTRYEIDIDNAIAAGELDVPEQFKPKAPVTTVVVQQQAQTSVADELVKLKKLKDDGILTQEEFDAQKKKLLEKKDQ